jgi:hypothetical protein
MGALSWFIPQEKHFFDMIEKQAENVLKGVDAFVDMLEHYDQRVARQEAISKIEGQGDQMVHDIFEELNRSFITPIDREDITHLVSSLDDVLDYVEAVAVAMVLYKVEKPPPYLLDLASTLHKSMGHVRSGIGMLKDFKNADKIRTVIKEVNTLENEADRLHRNALCDLFDGKDAVFIIKMKEIYDNTETATDKCEDVVDVMGDILVKYA